MLRQTTILCLFFLLCCSAYADDLLQLTNATRANHGLQALQHDPALSTAAQRHAKDMATHDYLDHLSRDGKNPEQRLGTAKCRYSLIAENIAAGGTTANSTLQQWLNSDGHRVNILNPEFEVMGIGRYQQAGSTYHTYWVQLFARRDDKDCVANHQQDARLLAALLAELGYYPTPLTTAIETQQLHHALKAFQSDMGFAVTGELDQITWQQLQTVPLNQYAKQWLQQQGVLSKGEKP